MKSRALSLTLAALPPLEIYPLLLFRPAYLHVPSRTADPTRTLGSGEEG